LSTAKSGAGTQRGNYSEKIVDKAVLLSNAATEEVFGRMGCGKHGTRNGNISLLQIQTGNFQKCLRVNNYFLEKVCQRFKP
jgi:hypothetical protein